MNIYLISFLIIYYLKYQSLYYNIIKTSKRLFFLSLDQIIIYNFRSLDKSLWKIFQQIVKEIKSNQLGINLFTTRRNDRLIKFSRLLNHCRVFCWLMQLLVFDSSTSWFHETFLLSFTSDTRYLFIPPHRNLVSGLFRKVWIHCVFKLMNFSHETFKNLANCAKFYNEKWNVTCVFTFLYLFLLRKRTCIYLDLICINLRQKFVSNWRYRTCGGGRSSERSSSKLNFNTLRGRETSFPLTKD